MPMTTPQEPNPLKVLVTSVAAKTPLLRELRKALQKLSSTGLIIGGDQDPDCPGRYFVDDFWLMPALKQLRIDELIGYCAAQGIRVIIPTRDGELPYFAKHRDQLKAEGITVMVSHLEAIETCLDKLAFCQAVTHIMPGICIPTSTELDSLAGETYVVKERYGAGSRNILLNASRQEARDWAEKLREPIFQPQVAGQEFSIDVYLEQSGKTKGALVRSRDLIVDGEAKISTTVQNTQLELTCSQLAEQLKLTGHVVFQGIIDQQMQFRLIECNCRFGGASTLSVAAGLDSFYWFMLESLGKGLLRYPFIRAKKELRQIRYAEDLLVQHPGA